MILEQLRDVAGDLRSVLSDLEPERLSGADADRLLKVFAEIEKLASGGKLLAARRVETSNAWRRKGHRSAAAHVAEVTGTGLGQAINSLATARQLGSLPTTEDALRKGRLSESQVKEIAGAATSASRGRGVTRRRGHLAAAQRAQAPVPAGQGERPRPDLELSRDPARPLPPQLDRR